jgi:LysR family transcriptional regulator (chromosome initiation inhibitor)
MHDYAQLAALAAVHRRGSFDLAAADLGVTPSAVSQRIRALEERSGTRLIRRGSPCAATAAGLRLVRHVEEVMLLEAALAADLPGPARQRVRLAVNADSLATWVIPALAAVDGLLFDLVIADQDVSAEYLRQGDVAAAITAEAAPLQGCDSVPLGALRYRATASPAFVSRRFPQGVTADALRAAPVLQFSDADRLQARWVEARTGGALRRAALPSHRMASSHDFVAACLAGIGWAMNPEALVAGHIAAGRLVDLDPALPLDVGLHWQYARLTAAALAPLTRAIRAAAGTELVAPALSAS